MAALSPFAGASRTGSTRGSSPPRAWASSRWASRCSPSVLPRRPSRSWSPASSCSGRGFALFSSPNTNAVMASVEKRSYGVASAILATMRLVGQMLSMGCREPRPRLFVGREAVARARRRLRGRHARRLCPLRATLRGGRLASLARPREARANTPPGGPASTPSRPDDRSSEGRFGAQPSTVRAFVASPTSLGGSPSRRGAISNGTSSPVTRRAVSITSSTE